jgi:hypothetical protein
MEISLAHMQVNDNEGFGLISGRLVGSSISEKNEFGFIKFYSSIYFY